MYIKEFYKNKKNNIHIIIVFLIIIIFIYLWSNSKDTFGTPSINQKIIYSLPAGTMIANIPESDRTYSTVFDDGKGTLLNSSTLDSVTCWAPAVSDTNQSIQLNLSTPTMVYGIVIKGRADYFFNYVKTFEVDYILLSPTNVKQTMSVDNNTIYNSNLYKYNTPDGIQTSYILFSTPISANSIIIKPQAWQISIAMRVDLLVNFVPRTTSFIGSPIINSVIASPVVIPTVPIITGYESINTDIIDSITDSYDSIKNVRNINLDNQDRINNIDQRIKKIKLDIGGISSKATNNIKAPTFY